MHETETLSPVPSTQVTDPPVIEIPAHVDTWDEYFINMAIAASIKSKDPRCPVGAVIVCPGNLILSTGFNGLARGMYDDEQLLLDAEEKLKVICHAEYNAIMNAARMGTRPLDGTTIYVTKFPCFGCCNAIVQAGIRRIYTHDNEYWKDDPVDKDHSWKRRILHDAKIDVVAPFHRDFMPARPAIVPKRRDEKKPVVSVTIPQALRAAVEKN
jgi:dCMP deaminase